MGCKTMKEIKLKEWGNADDVTITDIGGINLCCLKFGNGKWRADVSIRRISHTMIYGPYRKSLSVAKNDAIRMAKELLIDHYTSVVKLMSRFDIVRPEKEE